MEDRRSRLSITISFGAWRDRGENRGSPSRTESPKSPKVTSPSHASIVEQSAGRERTEASINASQQPASSMPPEYVVQGTMTEPTRPPLAILPALQRPVSQPTLSSPSTRSAGIRSSLPALPAASTTRESDLPAPSMWTKLRKLGKLFAFNKENDQTRKQRLEDRATTHVIYSLFVFCVSAILCTSLDIDCD
jgi:hypothetical protein